MSQVIRKYDSGGKAPEAPSLFEWADVGKYKKDEVVAGLHRNVDTYINNNGLKGEAANQFRTATSRFIDGIKNGTITMKGNGDFDDATGTMSSTGKYDKRFFGGDKHTDNNAFNRVGDYAKSFIKGMNPYSPEVVAEKKKEKFNYNNYIAKEISKKLYGGNEIDMNNFYKNRSEQERIGIVADIANNAQFEDFDNYNWDDSGVANREDLISRARQLGSTLSDKTFDNADYNSFAAIGGSNLDKWIKAPQDPTNAQSQSQVPQKPEGVSDEYWAAKQKLAAADKAKDEKSTIDQAANLGQPTSTELQDKAFEEFKALANANASKYTTIDSLPAVKPYNFDEVYNSRNSGSSKWDLQDNFVSYNVDPNKTSPEVYIQRDKAPIINTEGGLYSIPERTKAQELSNNLDYWLRESEKAGDQIERISTGEYVIPHTYDKTTGLIRVYDKNKRTLRYVPAHRTQTGIDQFNTNYSHAKDKDSLLKEGGVILAQSGIRANYSYDSKAERRRRREIFEKNKETQEQASAEANATSSPESDQGLLLPNKSKQQIKADSRQLAKGFTSNDMVRLGAIGADIISMIPGAGLVGVAGTGANLYADIMEDGADMGDFGRAAGNLALDAVGFIPGFGAAAKGNKVVKNVIKWAPRLLSAAAAVNYTGPGLSSLNKLMTPGAKVNVEDWRNIAEVVKLIVGGVKGVNGQLKANRIKNEARTGRKVITTRSGEDVAISQSAYDDILKNKSLADQQKAFQLHTKRDDLQLAGHMKFQIMHPMASGRVLLGNKVRDEFDFSKTRTVNTSDGPLEVPIVYDKHDQRIAKNMQTVGLDFDIPYLSGISRKYNDIKYRGAVKANRAKAEANVPVVGATRTEVEVPIQPTQPTLAVPTSVRTTAGATPSNLTTPTANINNAVRIEGKGTPVEAPNAKAIRTVNTINSILEPFVKRNLPAVIPKPATPKPVVSKPVTKTAKPVVQNARKVVQSQTVKPTKRLDKFLEDNIPGGRQFGNHRAKTERDYRDVFYPAAEREYNLVWNAPASKSNKFINFIQELKGKVTKKKEGGVLSLQTGNRVTRNVTSASDVNWNNDVFNSTGYQDTIGGITKDNLSHYNKMQNTYPTLGFGSNRPGANVKYSKAAADYQGMYENLTTVNNSSMANATSSGRIKGLGGSSDKGTSWKPDGLLGTQTWMRHLGQGNNSIANQNAILNKNGVEAYLNSSNNMVNYRPMLGAAISPSKAIGGTGIPTKLAPMNVGSKVPLGASPALAQANGKAAISSGGGSGVANKKFNLGILPEDMIATGRMLGGLATNNKAADQYKAGLKPTLISTWENTVPVMGNLFAKTSANKQASALTSMAGRPMTSDASLQLAGQLDAQNKAGDIRMQGDMMDAQEFARTRALSQQESDAAKARRVQVANQNKGAMNQIEAAKAQIDSAKTTADYQQVINPYFSGIEGQYRQNRAAGKQFDMEQARISNEVKFRPELQDLQDRYTKAGTVNVAPNATPEEKAAAQAKSVTDQKAIMKDYYAAADRKNLAMLEQRRGLTQMPWMFNRTSVELPSEAYRYAKGGQVDRVALQSAKDFNKRMLEDSKQLHKNINESKREHAKLLRSLSGLTAELIKKGMSWR